MAANTLVVFIQRPFAAGMPLMVGPFAFKSAMAVLSVAVQPLASVVVTVNV